MLANTLETVGSITLRSMVGIGSAPQLLLGEHSMMLHTSFSISTLYENRLGVSQYVKVLKLEIRILISNWSIMNLCYLSDEDIAEVAG